MVDMYGRQSQEEKNAICDQILARMAEEWTAASKRKLVLVQTSARRYQVIRISRAEGGVFHGSIVFQGTREDALIFIRVDPDVQAAERSAREGP
jgi:hypothetical protein